MKGTRSVERAWGKGDCCYPATFVLDKKIPIDKYIHEQNACLFHLQPSAVEGYGHVIHEGLGVGAIVATTDGPPMNESIGIGLRMKCKKVARQNLADVYDVSPDTIVEATRFLWGLDSNTIKELSERARQVFLDEREEFRIRLRELVG